MEDLDLLAQNANDIVLLVNNQGKIVDANNRAFETYGYSKEELLELELGALLSNESKARHSRRKMEIEENNGHVFESTHRRKDGTSFPVEVSSRVTKKEGQKHYLVIIRDITARKTLQDALRSSEDLLSKVFLQSPVAMLITSYPGGSILSANESFEKLFELNREEWKGRTTVDLNLWVDANERHMILEKIQSTGAVQNYEARFRSKSGTILECISSGTLIERHGTHCLLGTIIDLTPRLDLEKANRDSDAKLRDFVENTPDLIWSFDIEGRFTYLNPAVEQIYGYRPEELMGHHFSELLPAEQVSSQREFITQFLTGGETVAHYEFHGLRKDGRQVITSNHAIMLRGKDGKPKGGTGISRNITEERLSQLEIKRLSRLYAFISRVNHSIVRIRDREELLKEICRIAVEHGKFQMAWIGELNPAKNCVEPVTFEGCDAGYWGESPSTTEEEFSGTEPVLRSLLEGRPVICNIIHNCSISRTLREASLRRGYQSIAYFPIEVQGQSKMTLAFCSSEPDFFDEKEIDLLTQVTADVSFALETYRLEDERKESEHRAHEEKQHFRSLIENASDIMTVLDLQGNIKYESPSFERILGYEPETVLGKNVFDFVHPEDRSRVITFFQESLQNPSPQRSIEFRFQNQGGTWRYLEAKGSTFTQSSGNIEVVVNSRDISERVVDREILRETEEQFLQAQKMEAVGRLAGGIAHDFNNLLTAIIGYSDLLAESVKPDDPLQPDIQEIRQAGQRAANLTQQLLAFSRKQILQPIVFNLNETVEEMEKLIRRLIGEDIELLTLLEPELGSVRADPGQFEQVLMNLVVNARDAMPNGGRLTIETSNCELDSAEAQAQIGSQAGSFIILEVSDSGIGMSAETQSHLFEPFFTTKEKGKGTGLGLSTAYGIVKQSNGSICASSEPGMGTTIRIYLPRVDDQVQKVSMTLPPEKGLRETILVVEDEEGVRRFVAHSLQKRGYKVLVAANAGEALIACEEKSRPIDLMLTDVVLPQMDGRELAIKLAKPRPEMKVLYMSGFVDPSGLAQPFLGSGSNFIRKPFSIQALVSKVRQVLEQERNPNAPAA